MDKTLPGAAVLLCTFNGEAYLREQLDSILNQTYKNLRLYIRDDGSSDGTPAIIREYASACPNVRLVEDGEHLGYPGCFYALTDLDLDEDYYFFSDQDDVWFPDKVERAVRRLEEEGPDQILAYFAGYKLCNEQLDVIGHSRKMRGGGSVSGTPCLRYAGWNLQWHSTGKRGIFSVIINPSGQKPGEHG